MNAVFPILGIAVVLSLAGAVVFLTARRVKEQPAALAAMPLPPPASWTVRFREGSAGARERIAMAERLGVVGDAWSVDALERALETEHDAHVRDAIWYVLLRLRSGER